MYPRLALDIGWRDLAAGLAACLFAGGRERRASAVEAAFAAPAAPLSRRGRGGSDALVCLSVRSALDLYLGVLALPRGSEVLVSALTIPDMPRILEEHGLVVVPFEVDPSTLGPKEGALERLRTPRTRAILFAHLFGERAGLGRLFEFARAHGLLVWEDCAQAYAPDDWDGGWRGDERADLSLFSFGLIKTASAAGGGMACVRDPDVRERMRAVQRSWPVASRAAFAQRLLKAGILKTLGARRIFGVFARICERCGADRDELLHRATRGFPGPDLFRRLRRAPSAPLLALLERRLRERSCRTVARRRAAGEALLGRIGREVDVLGARARVRTHWVFAVRSAEPDALVARLRAAGYDATRRSSLIAVAASATGESNEAALELLGTLVFVPLVPQLDAAGLGELAALFAPEGEVVLTPHPRALPARVAPPSPTATPR